MSLISINKIVPVTAFAVLAIGFGASLGPGQASAASKSCIGLASSKLSRCCERLVNMPSSSVRMLTSATGCGGGSVICRRVRVQTHALTHAGGAQYECYSKKRRLLRESSDHQHQTPSHQSQGNTNQPAGKP